MTRLLEKPEELKVSANIEGTPLTITRNGKTERISRIYQKWCASEELGGEVIPKNYFTVRTSKGFIYDIYRNTKSNMWYLGKIHN